MYIRSRASCVKCKPEDRSGRRNGEGQLVLLCRFLLIMITEETRPTNIVPVITTINNYLVHDIHIRRPNPIKVLLFVVLGLGDTSFVIVVITITIATAPYTRYHVCMDKMAERVFRSLCVKYNLGTRYILMCTRYLVPCMYTYLVQSAAVLVGQICRPKIIHTRYQYHVPGTAVEIRNIFKN